MSKLYQPNTYHTKRSDLASEMIECGDDGDQSCPVCHAVGIDNWMTIRFQVVGDDNSYFLSHNSDPKLVINKWAILKCLNCEKNGVDTEVESFHNSQR